MIMLMRKWGSVLSERDLGANIRKEIINDLRTKKSIVIDFSGVEMINSSFADEVFGKLIADLGMEKAKKSLAITNVSETVKVIINEAIATRMSLHTR
jgi:anti-anti-sigma regulatory factor